MELLINICLAIVVLFNIVLAILIGLTLIPEMYARYKARKHVKRFMNEVVSPILKDIAEELEKEATAKKKKVSSKTK